jgi:non-heme Fe2+,alpha-ketoglutarate-dependent halogenase
MPLATASSSGLTREAFERDGYFCPLPVLTPAEVEHYLAQYMAFHERHQSRLAALRPNEKYRLTGELHFVFKWVYELATHPCVLDEVEKVLGPNILAWNTNWFTKMPGDKTYVSWHQDGSYWNLSPVEVATAWIALTPAGPENGCMRVIPGTHTKPFMPQRETYVPDNALSRGQEIAVEVDENNAVDFVLKPGEMSLHHIWIVHGSNANRSNTPRIGLAIRYLTPAVKQDSPGKPSALLVRGKDTHGNFELLDPPTSDEGWAGEGKHGEITERIRKSIMMGAGKKS